MAQEFCRNEFPNPALKGSQSLPGKVGSKEKPIRRYKILYFFLSYPEITQTGGDYYLVQLVEKLGKENEIVVVGSMSDYLFSRFKGSGAKVVRTPFFSKLDFSAIFKLRKIFFLEKPDIVHFNDPRARFIGAIAAKTLGLKTVSTYHSNILFFVGWLKKFFYRNFEKILTKHFYDGIIFVSDNMRKWHEKEGLLPKKNWRVIYNGINLEYSKMFLERKEEIKKRLSEKYGLEGGKIITFVGRLSKDKGLKYLVSASEEIVKREPQVKFVLIGDGEERGFVESEVKKRRLEKYFLLTGHLPKEKVYEFLISSDVFVLPSLYEFFPYVLLEAMSLGVPVVATRVGGVDEMIKNNFNGILIPPMDEKEIVYAIMRILNDKKLSQILIKNSFLEIKNYNQEKTVRDTFNLYREII